MSAGFPPETFWKQTFRTYAVALDGVMLRLQREHGERAWLAWTSAALQRQKRLPPLKDVIGKEKRRTSGKPKPASRLMAIAKMWEAVTGAKEKG